MHRLPWGWLVVVRAWNQPDEEYFATISDPREAEEEVRGAANITGQSVVKALRPLTRDEVDTIGLHLGKIVYVSKK